MNSPTAPLVVTIDVAHPPMRAEEAEATLEAWLRKPRPDGVGGVLKVIHGYGSSGKGGTLKETVRNWAYKRRGAFSLVVPGEEFSVFTPEVQEAIRDAGNPPLTELSDVNQGMTVLFL